MYKKMLIISLMLIMIPTLAFAETDSYDAIATISNAILSALSWVAYAIALAMLIVLGIKYLLSGANEKAKLKEKVFPYLIGVALIALCVTIAKSVANIASRGESDDPAGSFVDKTTELSGLNFGEREFSDEEGEYDLTTFEGREAFINKDGEEYANLNRFLLNNPILNIPETCNGKTGENPMEVHSFVPDKNREVYSCSCEECDVIIDTR